MKLSRVLIILIVLFLAAGIAFMVWTVHARMTGNEYDFQVEAVLSAAEIANGGEPLTDADRAVVAEYGGRRWIVVPGNYRALLSYLRKDYVAMPFQSIDTEKALKLSVCGVAEIWAAPKDASGDVVYVRLATGGKTFRVRTDGGNLWSNLLTCCTTGTYHDKNIPLP